MFLHKTGLKCREMSLFVLWNPGRSSTTALLSLCPQLLTSCCSISSSLLLWSHLLNSCVKVQEEKVSLIQLPPVTGNGWRGRVPAEGGLGSWLLPRVLHHHPPQLKALTLTLSPGPRNATRHPLEQVLWWVKPRPFTRKRMHNQSWILWTFNQAGSNFTSITTLSLVSSTGFEIWFWLPETIVGWNGIGARWCYY